MARDILNLRFFNMRLNTTEGAIQDFQIYQGKRGEFAFQHMRLDSDLLQYLQDEIVFHVADRHSSCENLASGRDCKKKHELQFYASPVAKGKGLNGESVNEAAPRRLQAFRTATLRKNQDMLTRILDDWKAKISALPDGAYKSHPNTQAFLNMDLECFFAYLIAQQMVPAPPRRGDVHIDGGPSSPALIISLGGDPVLEVTSKNKNMFTTRLAAGDVYVTTPSASRRAVVHEGSTRFSRREGGRCCAAVARVQGVQVNNNEEPATAQESLSSCLPDFC